VGARCAQVRCLNLQEDGLGIDFYLHGLLAKNDSYGHRLQPCMDDVEEPDTHARVVLVFSGVVALGLAYWLGR
jgi:hypothetical protein